MMMIKMMVMMMMMMMMIFCNLGILENRNQQVMMVPSS